MCTEEGPFNIPGGALRIGDSREFQYVTRPEDGSLSLHVKLPSAGSEEPWRPWAFRENQRVCFLKKALPCREFEAFQRKHGGARYRVLPLD